jgi:TolA-binding protein
VVERERFVYHTPKPPTQPSRPARARGYENVDDEDDEDFDLIARRKRRRINLYVIFACTVVVFAGYGLGNLGSTSSPSDSVQDQAKVDAALADAQTQLDATGDGGSPSDTDSDDVSDSNQDIGPTSDGIAAAQLPPPRPVVIPPPRAPDSPAVLTNIDEALANLDAHRWPEAKAAYDAVLERAPDHPRALYGRARALMGMKRYLGALTDLEVLFATDPDHPNALVLGATAATKLGRIDDARRFYTRYLEAWPKTSRAEEVRRLLEAL